MNKYGVGNSGIIIYFHNFKRTAIDLLNGDSYDVSIKSVYQSNVLSIFTEVSYNIQHLFKNIYILEI